MSTVPATPAAEQMALPTITVADLTEWLAELSVAGWDTAHFPNEWARHELAQILGLDMPYRRYSTTELTVLVARAKTVLTGECAS